MTGGWFILVFPAIIQKRCCMCTYMYICVHGACFVNSFVISGCHRQRTADGQHLTPMRNLLGPLRCTKAESGSNLCGLRRWHRPKQLDTWDILLMRILRVKDVVNTKHCLNPKVKDDEDVV